MNKKNLTEKRKLNEEANAQIIYQKSLNIHRVDPNDLEHDVPPTPSLTIPDSESKKQTLLKIIGAISLTVTWTLLLTFFPVLSTFQGIIALTLLNLLPSVIISTYISLRTCFTKNEEDDEEHCNDSNISTNHQNDNVAIITTSVAIITTSNDIKNDLSDNKDFEKNIKELCNVPLQNRNDTTLRHDDDSFDLPLNGIHGLCFM